MLDELRRLDWFPFSFIEATCANYDEAMRACEHEKGRPATEDELCQITGLDVRDVRQGLEALQNRDVAFTRCYSGSCINRHCGKWRRTIPPRTAMSELAGKIAPLIEDLTPREKLVLSLYCTDELNNMRETAEIMGITEGRVSQLHSQALNRLRRSFINIYGDSVEFLKKECFMAYDPNMRVLDCG